MQTSIRDKGINLSIIYDYTPKEDGFNELPDIPAIVIIEKVLHCGVDIYDILPDRVIEDLEQKLLIINE